jgi:hypothetical protein
MESKLAIVLLFVVVIGMDVVRSQMQTTVSLCYRMHKYI